MAKDSKSRTKKLGVRQRRTRFVKEYLKDKNATRAAIAAGYSERTAKQQGSQLLTKLDVRSQIEKENEKINAKLDVTVEHVKELLTDVGGHLTNSATRFTPFKCAVSSGRFAG